MRNGLPYYKAYPRDFIEGTIGMPFEIKCAYRVILDLIYMQGGKLPDDARYISGLLGCSIRKWKSIRSALIQGDKINVSGEFLTNKRADSELETLTKVQVKQRENASKVNKNNDLQKPWLGHTEPEPERSIASYGEASKFDEMQSELFEAARLDGFRDERHPNLLDLSPILGLVEAGFDLKKDILPVIRAKCQGEFRPKSWRYFVEPVRDACKVRQSAASIPKPSNEIDETTWIKRLDYFNRNQDWPHAWGPPLGQSGCKVPEHLVREVGAA